MTRQTCCRFSPNGARNPRPRTTGMAGRWAKPFPSLFPKTALFFNLYLQQYTPQEGALVAASARPSLWHRPSNPAILCALTKAFPYGVKKKGIYFINDYVCVYTHKKRTCLPPKLCVYLNCVCQVQQISYGAICPEQMAAIWFHWALESKSSCSQTLLLVLILPRSSHFPKQLLHPLTQRLWKISLHRYILMLNSNFIPLYRCSDARNKLNKNMFSFPGIFVRLNTQIASWWLEII